MKIQAELVQRAEQRLALVPQMLQSIEVLQLAAADLLKLIDRELEENETLELVAVPETADAGPGESAGADEDDAGEWRIDRGPAPADDDGRQRFMSNLPAAAETLMDFIRSQVAWRELQDPLARAVLALAEHLDDRGLLALSDEEIREIAGEADADLALRVLQSLEPRGIGARDPIEAMILQVSERDPDREDIEAMLRVHLRKLSRNKIPEVARALGRSLEEVQALLARISGLDPRPAARFSRDGAAVIQPDAVVHFADGVLEVSVDDSTLPELGIVDQYQDMVKSAGTARDVRRYLRDKLQSARGLIEAVEQRRRTLGRVVAAVMDHQREFLETGRTGIRPLKMAQVAEQLDLHTSTVSRAISGKHVQTGWGIFALRDFFDGGRGADGSGAVGSGRMAVKQRIRELVEAEDPARPLSDDDLVARLSRHRIKVARRTVTKYRKELGIQSSWLRRRHGKQS